MCILEAYKQRLFDDNDTFCSNIPHSWIKICTNKHDIMKLFLLMSAYLALVAQIILPDGLSCQALEWHLWLRFQDDLRHPCGWGWEWCLAGCIDRVYVSSSLQQGHDDGVEGQEVRDYLLVRHYYVQGGVLSTVNSLTLEWGHNCYVTYHCRSPTQTQLELGVTN